MTKRCGMGLIGGVSTLAGVGAAAGALMARGSLTLDVDIGRRIRPLGPIELLISAPREKVFNIISAPYLKRTPRALASKLQVLERGENMAVAAHFTPVNGFVTTTVESVLFEPPEKVHFRLLRGPVPYVTEQFILTEDGDNTRFEYRGELGTDFWVLGQLWGNRIASRWEATVQDSLQTIKAEAERLSKPTRR